ncbi:MAG: hypothetical protein AAF959_30270 [Cyanobacteria bacterium P01_D01_bin.56]
MNTETIRGVIMYPMAYLSVRPRLSEFIKSAAVVLGAAVITNLAPSNAFANATSTNSPLVDGVYLYGQQAAPDQLGSVYMVFEVTAGHAVGAFYMPSSSFDCFSGNVAPNRLDLTVIDSYEQTSHPYSLEAEPTVVAGQAAEYTIDGFTPLSNLSDTDQQLLETCQTVQTNTL